MKSLLISFLFSSLFTAGLKGQSGLIIKSQESGPFRVNSYLLFDPVTKEAAFIDTGSLTDTLLSIIEKEHLELKYIFLTHAHQDHIAGVNEVLRNYPKAKLFLSEEEYTVYNQYTGWRNLFDTKSAEAWQGDTSIVRLMDFIYKEVRKPDIFLSDNQIFLLGKKALKVIKTPGHSPGSLTFAADNCIFSGDLILYHSTGYLDYPLCSRADMVNSIRRIYEAYPDETIIYSGHGKSSTIGYEKINNKNVTSDKVIW